MINKNKIEFWQDENGYSEAQEYIWDLQQKSLKSKDARIKLKKIIEYMDMLETYGTEIGYPYIDHIEGCEESLFELRPLRDRFFFFFKKESRYIILNRFMKTTRKTPKKEIEKALRLMKDFNERNL